MENRTIIADLRFIQKKLALGETMEASLYITDMVSALKNEQKNKRKKSISVKSSNRAVSHRRSKPRRS